MATAQSVTPTKRDLETRLIEKAWKDPAFRKEVVRDPKGMFEKCAGQKLPAQLSIHVHEEDANTLHLSIPPAPSNLNELSDDDLEKVAGGTEIVAIAVLDLGSAALIAGISAGGAAASAVGTAGAVLGGTGAW